MPYPSNALTLSQVSALAPSASNPAQRIPPDVLTYSYATRMVYVTPGETYDHAIDIAKDSFLELRDVDRERISLEVHVVLKNQQARRTAEIGRTAWPVVVASLARFEIVEIRVASGPPVPPKPAGAHSSSSSRSSTSEPPPYVSEKGWYSDYSSSQTSLVPCRQQISSSQTPSLATRVVDLLTPKSSRSRLSPQPYQF